MYFVFFPLQNISLINLICRRLQYSPCSALTFVQGQSNVTDNEYVIVSGSSQDIIHKTGNIECVGL